MTRDILVNSELNIFKDAKWLKFSTITSVWWKSENEGRFKIKGAYPSNLDTLKNGDTLEILHRVVGRRDEYDSSLVIARLKDCQIRRKWFLQISPSSPEQQEVFCLYLSLTCTVELLV